MRKKLLTILVCVLMIASTTMIIIKPENLAVEASGEVGSGNNAGINITYVHSIAQTLSDIVKDKRFPKGRSYGTPGEWYAKNLTSDWMTQIGLYNVHTEPITNAYDHLHPFNGAPINNKLEPLSENLTVNHTNIRQSEFFIDPRWNFTMFPPLINLLFSKSKLTHTFTGENLIIRQRPYRYGFDHAIQWCIDDLKKLIDNGTIFDFDSFANYTLEKFAEYFNFSWDNMINDPLNTTIVNNSQWNDNFNFSTLSIEDDFLYIDVDPLFNPKPPLDLVPPDWWVRVFPDPENPFRLFYPEGKLLIQFLEWRIIHPHCHGLILYDFNDNTHDMPDFSGLSLPVFFVNESLGSTMENHTWDSNYLVNYSLNQKWEENVTSYNVIGQINGTTNKTVIVDCLYDSVWDQGAADSAIGIGMVLAIAKEMKYLNDTYHIKPEYNVKFVAFGGEEHGGLGAMSYDWRHANENITTLIDLNQLGFNQTGPQKLTLGITTNNKSAKPYISAIANDTQYVERMKDTTNFTIRAKLGGDDSDDKPFAQANIRLVHRRNCTTIGFLKDTTWTLHHRDGNNHTEGDVMKYFNWTDVNATASMIWNVTKYYTLNPNCSIRNISMTTFDSPNDGDTLDDSIRTNFTIHSIMPNDRVRVEMDLGHIVGGFSICHLDAWDTEYIMTNGSLNFSHTFTIPDNVTDGNYSVNFKVYNSTGRINRIINGLLGNYYNDATGSSGWYHLYHPLGYTKAGQSIQSIQNRISGSVFTANENAWGNNITAFINQCYNHPGPYKCMLYRANDSKLIGTTTQNWVSLPQQSNRSITSWWAVFNFTGTKPQLVKDVQYVISCWGKNASSNIAYDTSSGTTGKYENYTYGSGTPPTQASFINESKYYSIYCSYTPVISPPKITNVAANPQTTGFGYNVTITANVIDNGSGVNQVKVHITPPSGIMVVNYTMTHGSGTTYSYTYTNTWSAGQYNYTIWAVDNSTHSNSSAGHHFNVSAQATISIATLKDSYTGNQYINITDPPDPPQNLTLVGRGLTWNTYYDPSSGDNILETYLGPVNYQDNNGSWTPINDSLYQLASNHPAYSYGYRIGNNRGVFGAFFKPNIQNDWPVAFTYNRSNNPTAFVLRSKLVGVGYVDPQSNWAYQYLQNAQSSQGQTFGNVVTYPGVFTGTDVTWSYGNTELKEAITMSNATKTVLQNHPPSQYGLHDASSYLVFITKLDRQGLNLYNSSGLLSGNVTVSDTGVDFRDALGQFKCGLPLGEAYELSNDSVRQKLMYRILQYNGNTYLLSGVKVSDLSTMIFPVVIDPTLTVSSLLNDGSISNSSSSYGTARNASSGTVDSSSTTLTIGQMKTPGFPPSYSIYRGFVLFNTSTLPSNAYLDNATLSLYLKDDLSLTDFLLTIQNGQPTYPHNPLQTGDYARSHYQGNGGSLNTANLVNGRNNITLTNLNWINKTGTTKLCLRSSRDINGTAPTSKEFITVYSANYQLAGYGPKLIINYRNQSKIKNTGSTTIKGYLLIQVQFYNTSQGKWLVDKDTINETSPRAINSGSQLALDSIFNWRVRASDLTHGTGTYRVYTALRGPFGNILKTNDGVELKAWWQFSKT